MIVEPLISIVIPTFNRANLIGETLNSVLVQTYSNWECILVDDGSTDNSREVIETYLQKDSRFRYFERPSDRKKGANACRNYGFEQSKGKYVKWFDSDDLLLPEALEKQLNVLEKSSKGITVSEYHLFRDTALQPIVSQCQNANISDLFQTYISGAITLNTQIILFKRELVERFRFDETLSRAQDLDFIYRILKEHNNEVVLQNEVLVQIRAHSNSITGDFHKGNLNSLESERSVRERIFTENYNDSELPSGIRQRTLVLYLNSLRALLINGYFQEYKRGLKQLENRLNLVKRLKIKLLFLLAAFYNRTRKGIYIYGLLAKKI